MDNVLIATAWFLGIGGVLGLILAVAAKLMNVKKDEREEKIEGILPGANCGGCGYPGCSGYAKAVAQGKAKSNLCNAGGDAVAEKIAEIMGSSAEKTVRYRAQVMCSGTTGLAKKKYELDGIRDCVAASRLAGGDKMCPNGCIGLGTCVAACPFGAISVVDGVAAVSYEKCKACGMCVSACPKGIIKLIPYDSKYWVGCMSQDTGAKTRSYCEVGCISCKLCEKNCPEGAIKVSGGKAEIDYEKCTSCGKCASVCPRKIIRSGAFSDTEEKSDVKEKTEE